MKSGRGEPRVLLLAMPWNRWDYPSIQVGLLEAYLRAHGVVAQARYPYLDLAHRLGAETYNRLADKLPPLLAESFFTVGVRGGDSLPEGIRLTGARRAARLKPSPPPAATACSTHSAKDRGWSMSLTSARGNSSR